MSARVRFLALRSIESVASRRYCAGLAVLRRATRDAGTRPLGAPPRSLAPLGEVSSCNDVR